MCGVRFACASWAPHLFCAQSGMVTTHATLQAPQHQMGWPAPPHHATIHRATPWCGVWHHKHFGHIPNGKMARKTRILHPQGPKMQWSLRDFNLKSQPNLDAISKISVQSWGDHCILRPWWCKIRVSHAILPLEMCPKRLWCQSPAPHGCMSGFGPCF